MAYPADSRKDNDWVMPEVRDCVQTDDQGLCFPVAVVGIACKFPGVETPEEYRKVLLEKLCTYGAVPEEKWSREEWHTEPGKKQSGYANTDVLGVIGDLDLFDNTFFNISPKEAMIMDKHHFRIMEVTQLALDDAGLTLETIPQDTGVYMSTPVGQMPLPIWQNTNTFSSYSLTGGSHSVAANRVNFFYDIRGPSLGVESGCASALNNIHLALLSLWHKESEAVIVGGANCIWAPEFHIGHCQTGQLSELGEARPFDKDADGRVRSEGCSVAVLKPLTDAIKDGDHIYCVIRGSVRGYHGSSPDMCLNDVEPVCEVLEKLYSQASLSPDDVHYIEASASGVPSDDVLEAKVISRVFGQRKDPIRVGSCKANIGHAEQVSGMASLIKCALMLGNREFYPQANFNEINPNIPAAECNLKIQERYEKYEKSKPMLVGINSISTTGQVTHLLLEEYKDIPPPEGAQHHAGWHFGVSGEKGKNVVVVLTAKNKAALREMANQWHHYKNAKDDAQVVAAWLASRRNHYRNRLVIIANSGDDFRAKMQDFLDGQPNDGVIEGTAPGNFHRPKICFVFPGQGQQWKDMGRSLYANEPVYRDVVDKCDKAWQKESGFSFIDRYKLFIPVEEGINDGTEDIDEIPVCQPAIVVHEFALCTLIRHWGIEPDMLIGHSLGDIATAFVGGTMTLDECMISLYHRATTQWTMSGTGKMAAARFTPEQGQRFCEGFQDLYVACYNSTDSITLAGGNKIIDRLAEENPKKLKVIPVKAPFHTTILRPIRDEYLRRVEGKYTPKYSKDITIYSSVTKDLYCGPHDAQYWWCNIEQPVYFLQANEAIFRDHGNDVLFVEIAARPTLLSCIRQTANNLGISPAGYVTLGSRTTDDWLTAIKGLIQLYVIGFPVNWRHVTRNCARYADLPPYPFQRNYAILETELYREKRLGLLDKSYRGRYGEIDVQMHPFLVDCRFNGTAVMPVSGWIEYLIEMIDQDKPCLRDVSILNTPKVFEKNVLGEFDGLFVEAIAKGDELRLQAKTEAWNINPDQPRGLYATAINLTQSGTDSTDKLHINSIYNRCGGRLVGDRVYEKLSEMGWQYGESFRVVRDISYNHKEAIARLAPEVNKYERLKTITLDGAFQVGRVCFAEKGESYHVTRVDRVQLNVDAVPLNEDLYVYCKLRSRWPEGFCVNIYITDQSGRVVTSLLGSYFEREKYEAFLPCLYCLYSDEAIKQQHNVTDITQNEANRMTKSEYLRELTSVKVRGCNCDIREKLAGSGGQKLKCDGVIVTPKAFSRVGRLVHCCGRVEQVGRDVRGWKPGDRVVSLRSTTCQWQQIFDEDDLVSIGHLSWAEGSAIGFTYGVASYVLSDLMMVKPDDKVYIADCRSGIGEACAWLAHLDGATVLSRDGNSSIPFVEVIENDEVEADVIIWTRLEQSLNRRSGYISDKSRMCWISYGSDVGMTTDTDQEVTGYYLKVNEMLRSRREMLKDHLVHVIKLIDEGRLPNLYLNVDQFNVDKMLTSEDVQTMVLADEFLPNNELSELRLNLESASTYLVCGDFNSITAQTVEWLIEHGAKNIAIVTDNIRTINRNRHRLDTWKQSCINLYEMEADLTADGQLEKVCEQLEAVGAPVIGGMWITADASCHNQGSPTETVQTNILSARRCARECKNLNLDYFVMLVNSKVRPENSTAKQFVLMAEERRSSKLPALVMLMSLGSALSDVNTEDQSTDIYRIHTCLEVMEMLLIADNPPAAVAIIDKNEADVDKRCIDDAAANIKIKEKIILYLCEELLISACHFDDNLPLKQYGVDYFIGSEFVRWLQSEFNLNLTVNELFGNNLTLADLLSKIHI